jgi:antitoxin MazE
MLLHVKKWGNSAAVRIPASVIFAANMHINQAVDIREEEGRIIIDPVIKPEYDLATLLADMSPESFHEDIDFGKPMGEELW